MHAHGAIGFATPKLATSEEWTAPIPDGAIKHRRFVWATQFGVGPSGAGVKSNGDPTHARHRHELNRARKLAPIKLASYPGKSEKPASWWRDAR